VACLPAYSLVTSVKYVFSPFLDHDLFDFLSSLPAAFFVDHTFHSDTIRYAYPEYADLPFADTVPAPDHTAAFRGLARAVAVDALSRGRSGLLRRSFVLPRLARCLVDSSYAPAATWLGGISIYLLQLERAGDLG
jgi:hypothetical protein